MQKKRNAREWIVQGGGVLKKSRKNLSQSVPIGGGWVASMIPRLRKGVGATANRLRTS